MGPPNRHVTYICFFVVEFITQRQHPCPWINYATCSYAAYSVYLKLTALILYCSFILGSVYPEIWNLLETTFSKWKVYFYGTRWPGNCPLHHH